MATNKLLKRIVAPDIAIEKAKSSEIASELHNYTHGINSDPLTVFAIVFSALIHDVGKLLFVYSGLRKTNNVMYRHRLNLTDYFVALRFFRSPGSI